MRFLLGYFLCILGRIIFSFRYRVKITGKEMLHEKSFNSKYGILFLPNHPALVDPIFISIYLWPKFRVHPLVVEYVYRQKGIHSILKLAGALSIPNMDTSLNDVKIKNAQQVIEKIIQGLKNRENYILYPSGRLKLTGKEIIGGASATHAIFQQLAEVNVVLVRTSGLWGSSFSRAYNGYSPDFNTTAMAGIKNVIKSFLFFIPKRRVLIEIEVAKNDFPRYGSRLEINRYLEKWFNQYQYDSTKVEEEPLTKVSYSVFKGKFYEVKTKSRAKKMVSSRKYSSKVEEIIFGELSRMQPNIEIKDNMDLATDLGLDSLDVAELITFLSVHFDVGEVHPEDIETVADVLELAEGKPIKKKRKELPSAYTFPDEVDRPLPIAPGGKTIIESFLLTCDRMKNFAACGDDLLGVLSYKKLKIAALVFSKEIKKMEGSHIGVLLPASTGAYLVILSILLGGKIPVMLNWTLGPRYLNHMITLTHTEAVISSWKFLERLTNIELGDLTQKLFLLEDIKKGISRSNKLKGFFLSFKNARSLVKALKIDQIKEDDEAVILFTSGTEANPKGVPLSNKNILSNLREAMQGVSFTEKDIMYGFLPPFHSFGFSVAGLFPLLIGMKVAYSPDPTDSFSLAEGIQRWKISLFCAAPSFLKGILQAATKEQLVSMRLFITGAEKASKDLYDKVAALGEGKKLIEGYGITECSPIVTLVREDKKPVGVGELVSGIDFITIHPETHEKLASVHEEGEMCVYGPNVFKGYLGEKRDPFIFIDGKKWYRTGDLGYMDGEGNIILSGRLKRFAKIGAEMISLGGIEEIILKALTIKNIDLGEGVPIAICAIEKEAGKTELVLITTLDLEPAEVNMMLKDAGCSRLIRVARIMKIDVIPLMGTGKTDYRFLQKIIE